jgi:predicted O-linked N-acetylglucosamine transferase (SPINDLY family)
MMWMTRRARDLVALARSWIAKLGDKAAAAQIVRDEVDILIDLHGCTDGGRPGVFALRPAPIIVNWFGYPGTGSTKILSGDTWPAIRYLLGIHKIS